MTQDLCNQLTEGIHVTYLLFYWADFIFLYKKASVVRPKGHTKSMAYRVSEAIAIFGCTLFIPFVMLPLQYFSSYAVVFEGYCAMGTTYVEHHITFLVCTFFLSVAFTYMFAEPLNHHAQLMESQPTLASNAKVFRSVLRKNLVLAVITGIATIGTPIMAISLFYEVTLANLWAANVGGLIFGMDVLINAACAKMMTTVGLPRSLRPAGSRAADDVAHGDTHLSSVLAPSTPHKSTRGGGGGGGVASMKVSSSQVAAAGVGSQNADPA